MALNIAYCGLYNMHVHRKTRGTPCHDTKINIYCWWISQFYEALKVRASWQWKEVESEKQMENFVDKCYSGRIR